MQVSRSGTFHLLVIGVLAFLALRPVTLVDRTLETLFAPARLLGELGFPVRLLRSRTIHAAERRVRESTEFEATDRRRVLARVRTFGLPQEERLRRLGVRYVPGNVLRRVSGDRDRILVDVPPDLGVEVGLAVVSGDAFVGWVDAVHEGGERIEVALITGRATRVGALATALDVPAGEVVSIGGLAGERSMPPFAVPLSQLVVGGLTRGEGLRSQGLRLALHNPSRSLEGTDSLVVFEPSESSLPSQQLANGFRLGSYVSEAATMDLSEYIRPSVDFRSGLVQLFVLVPADENEGDGLWPPLMAKLPDARKDGHWRRVRFSIKGAAEGWREGGGVNAGFLHGVQEGDAVVSGVRFLGRVCRAGLVHSKVSLLGDPGFSVPVLADLGGRPQAIGRVLSLGRDPSTGDVRCAWEPQVDIVWGPEEEAEEDGYVYAQLYTGAGEIGLVPGLWIGEARLSRASGRHVIEIRQPADTRRVYQVSVRASAKVSP